MKKYSCTLFILFFMIVGYAQESAATYKKAVNIVINSQEFKDLDIDRYTFSKQSISFINSAYAFYLEEPELAFVDYDFENYFGEFYQPIEILEFQSLRDKKRAQHIMYVSETEQDHFVIELLSFKRKKRSKYPKFYSGTSYYYLFKKKKEGEVQYVRTIKVKSI